MKKKSMLRIQFFQGGYFSSDLTVHIIFSVTEKVNKGMSGRRTSCYQRRRWTRGFVFLMLGEICFLAAQMLLSRKKNTSIFSHVTCIHRGAAI
jgi:hypothetical protein